jgi:hypothetical protein
VVDQTGDFTQNPARTVFGVIDSMTMSAPRSK